MARFKDYRPKGVIPATLLAFKDDLSIDERETRRHLAHVAATRGLSAITRGIANRKVSSWDQ